MQSFAEGVPLQETNTLLNEQGSTSAIGEAADGFKNITDRIGNDNAKSAEANSSRDLALLAIQSQRLERSDEVEEAVVIVVEKKNNRRLEAVVRLRDGSKVEVKELIIFCKTLLPPYAIPEMITIMNSF